MSVMYAGYVWNMVYFVGDFDGLRAGNLVLVNLWLVMNGLSICLIYDVLLGLSDLPGLSVLSIFEHCSSNTSPRLKLDCCCEFIQNSCSNNGSLHM
jgi:hypothetical protein